jgi:PRA1 family protein 1
MMDGETAKVEMADKMAFMEAAPVKATAAGVDTPAVSNATNLYGQGNDEPLPSYASIVASEESIVSKAQLLYNVTQQHIQRNFSALRPWSEFFDTTFFHSPAGITDVVNRLNRNLPYFYANYLVLSLVCSSYILLINLPFSVYAMLLVFFYLFVRNRATAAAVLAAQGASEEEQRVYIVKYAFTISQLYLMMIVFGVIGFYLTNGSSAITWLLLTSLGISLAHAGMRRPPIQDSAFDFV